jgi:hypothetical protein
LLSVFIDYLIDEGNDYEEVIRVLKKVECPKPPGLDDIDSKIVEQHIGNLPLCRDLPTSTLRSIYDKLRYLISDASSKTEEGQTVKLRDSYHPGFYILPRNESDALRLIQILSREEEDLTYV